MPKPNGFSFDVNCTYCGLENQLVVPYDVYNMKGILPETGIWMLLGIIIGLVVPYII